MTVAGGRKVSSAVRDWAIVAGVATVLGTAASWVVALVDRSRRRLLFGIRTATPISTWSAISDRTPQACSARAFVCSRSYS